MLRLHVCRFEFQASDAIYFPPGKSGNVLRGAFGLIFKDAVPEAVYRRIFRPEGGGSQPSGFADPPRPFVIRAAHLDGRRFEPRENFHFHVHLFEAADPPVSHFAAAFGEFARRGVGPTRGRARLLHANAEPVTLPLGEFQPASRALVRFLTPTELKSEGRLLPRPYFEPLICRIRDRVCLLAQLYGDCPVQIDHCAFAARASKVRLVRCRLAHEAVDRRSARTGQTHPIGGLTGEAEYEGELSEFVPYLQAAYYTGVGRHTVWGNGAIQTQVIPAG